MDLVPRRVIAVLMALTLVVAGCSGGTDDSDAAHSVVDTSAPTATATPEIESTETVTEDGFRIGLGAIVVEGPAGVAPAGTVATISEAEVPPPAAKANVDLAVPAFDISLGGLQPEEPITVTVTFDDPVTAGHALGFVTQPSGTDQWIGVPVMLDGRDASVELDHLSIGVFGWFGDHVAAFTDAASTFLGLTYAPPDCHGRSLEMLGFEYSAATDNDKLYVCVEEQGGQPVLTVHSNSPFVWRLAVDRETAMGADPVAPPGVVGFFTQTLVNLVLLGDYDAETVLIPGGSAPVQLLDQSGTRVRARVDAGLGLAAIAGHSVVIVLDMFGLDPEGVNLLETAECVVGAGAIMDDPDAAVVIREVLSCAGGAATGLVGFVLGGLTSLSGLLAAQVMGLIGELTGTNSATIEVGTHQSGWALPPYCDQPERVAPVGHSEPDGKSNDVSEPATWETEAGPITYISMFCSAGGVTWPGVLLFYDDSKTRIAEIYLSDLEEDVYRGTFKHEEVAVDGADLVVPYGWQTTGGLPYDTGVVLLRWDGTQGGPVVVNDSTSQTGTSRKATGDVAGFVSPSGNLFCGMHDYGDDGVSVACNVMEKNYEPEPLSARCDLGPGWPGNPVPDTLTIERLGTRSVEVGWQCATESESYAAVSWHQGSDWHHSGDALLPDPGGDPKWDLAVLSYGQSLTLGELECSSAEIGVTCTYLPTGEGFTVSSRDFVIF